MKKNPFDFFDAIYCLTTEARAEKYEAVMREFELIGISERIIKFNGTETNRRYEGRTTNYQTLASASHLEIWRLAAKKGLSNVLIFEDDFSLMGWDNNHLAIAIDYLKMNSWELFYLGYNLYGDSFDSKRVNENLIGLPTGVDVRSTHAYSLNNASYEKILNYDPFVDKVVDQWLPSTLMIHCLVPLMNVQNQVIQGREKREIFMENYKDKLRVQK
jgi:hypothetical protein